MSKLKYNGCIYVITNKINGKQYIGKTNDFHRRYNEHFGTTKEPCVILRRAMNKYGKENFVMESIFEVRTKNLDTLNFLLNSMERYFIHKYNTYKKGYNATLGGEGTCGMVVSEETRKKRSLALKGRHFSKERIEKMRECRKGIPMSKEAYEKFMMWFPYRDKKSIYKKVGDALRGRKRDRDMIMRGAVKRRKPILQYTLQGDFVQEVPGSSLLKSKINANIIACCKGRINSAYGYIWRYKHGNMIPMKIEVKGKTHTANKPILQYTKNGIFIQEFSSVNDAVNKTGISRSALANCLANLSQSCGGYNWCYKEKGGLL